MRHFDPQDPFNALSSQAGVSMLVLLLVGSLLVIAVIALFAARTKRDARPGGAGRAEIYEDLDGQIRALLAQAGGALNQDEIRDYLDIPVTEVAKALHSLEKSGEIARDWEAGAYTYRVKLA